MNIDEFTGANPDYAFDFARPIGRQPRIYADSTLETLPLELTPVYPYRSGGRGRPNRNQTRTHAQCATCKRVLRNDQFYTPPSLKRRNVLFPHCLRCTQARNAERHAARKTTTRSKMRDVRRFLGAMCTNCGFTADISAIDLHHPERIVEQRMETLIEALASSSDAGKAEELLRLCRTSVPLCANCHRMYHAGALDTLPAAHPADRNLAALLQLLKQP